ncbi:MAG: hypothetical protein SCH66_02255 [Methanolobus sp.]|nr:hypothetical protein [Methanolobus sp.]
MNINVSKTEKDVSSVEILKGYVRELPIKSMGEEWIKEQKVDLDALMADRFPGSGSCTLPSRMIR